jgi:hypothetical protein
MITEDAQIDLAKQHIEDYVRGCGAHTADDSAQALLLLGQLAMSAMEALVGRATARQLSADSPRCFAVTAQRPN